MYRGPLAFHQLAQLLVTNVEAVLAASLGGPVDRACVVPGEVAWDGCDCGMLAVAIRRWGLSDDFPQNGIGEGTQRATPCDAPWLVAELRIQVVRCAPSPDGTALLTVPCSDLDAAAEVLTSDAYITLTEVISTLCELRADEQILDYVLGTQETIGPAGGCVGSELVAFVAVDR